jgi:hypothetical protein
VKVHVAYVHVRGADVEIPVANLDLKKNLSQLSDSGVKETMDVSIKSQYSLKNEQDPLY